VRRKFYDARKESTFAAQIVQEISRLYQIESHLRADPELDRKVVRQAESVPVLNRIEEKLEIDNNLVENAIRPTAIGKKNWLFFGSAAAGQTSAVLYSLIETCRKLNINPHEYLSDILTVLPTMTNHTAKNYTPEKWKATRENMQG